MDVEVFSSWLRKKHAKSGILSRGWSRRWFGLSRCNFYYYKSSRERNPSGDFPMQSFKRIRRRSELEFEVSFTSRTLFLRAENSVDVDRWFQAFSTISDESHARRADDALTADRSGGAADRGGRRIDGEIHEDDRRYINGCPSPPRHVLECVPKMERRQSSPTSPLHLGSGGSEASGDSSRPESAVASLELPAKGDEQRGRGAHSATRIDTGDVDVDDDNSESNKKISPRALLANPSKAFGTFFATTTDVDDRNLRSPTASYAEATSVMTFAEEGADHVSSSPSSLCASMDITKKARGGVHSGGDVVIVADANWIEEDFDDDDGEDALPSKTWTHSTSVLQSPGAAVVKSTRRSLELDMYMKHGDVLPDQNWVDEDWDDEE